MVTLYILDTVGMLARVIGGENFYPITEEWIKISLVMFALSSVVKDIWNKLSDV